MCKSTQNRHLRFCKQIFDHAYELMDLPESQLFRKLTWPKSSLDKTPDAERDRWLHREIQMLFSTPNWTGCSSASKRSVAGSSIIKDENYWVPLLVAFAGLRGEEAAQLQVTYLRHAFGIPFIHVQEGDGRVLKNRQSRRIVPLHDTLIRLGFIEHWEQARKQVQQIFPNLRQSGKYRRYYLQVYRWWSNY